MGNNASTNSGLRLSSGDRSYQVQLGESAVLYFKGRKVKQESAGLTSESWRVSYNVDKSSCNVTLSKRKFTTSSKHHEEKLYIAICDDAFLLSECCFHVTVYFEKSVEAGLLRHFICLSPYLIIAGEKKLLPISKAFGGITSFACSKTNTWGVTETRCYFYGKGTRRGLIIVEEEKKSEDQKSYTGFVAHYYANTEKGQNVGLSASLKRIRVLDCSRLDFDVVGPEQHPVTALIYMFDETRRTRTWKPTYCPHCADNIIQRQHAGVGQSDENESNKDPGRGGKKGDIVSNKGWFKGHNMGNTFIKYFIGRK